MIVRDFTSLLEQYAPLSTQESYDNSGLIVGSSHQEVTGVLISLDCIEATVDEAIQKNANLIIAHHPIVFKGLKKLNGKNYVERTVIKAIKNDIAIYAIHTNLDNYINGVNAKIGDRLGIYKRNILAPMEGHLEKLVVFAPKLKAQEVRKAMFDAGAGEIGNYSHCSFNGVGEGTFKAGDNSDPFVGKKGEIHHEEELKIEVIVPKSIRPKVVHSMMAAHPYEEVAFDVFQLNNPNFYMGAGMYGDLEEAIPTEDFLKFVKQKMKAGVVRYTPVVNDSVQRVAWCGGAGSFLIHQAKAVGADIYITGDVKYHEFFDAENDLVIADIGHYESEQFTIELLSEYIMENFPNFAVHLTRVNTNPINYL